MSAAGEEQEGEVRWSLVAALFALVSVSAFEITAVLTALPTIVDELNGRSYYGATLAAYLLATLVSTVGAGELADRLGPRLPLVLGSVSFIVGLLVCGTAHSPAVVVIGRVLQGLGAGALSTLTYVIIRRSLPERFHPRMYALMSAAWVFPSLVAPLVAGWITDRFGWRWVFLSLIPVIVVASGIVWLQARAIAHAPEGARRSASRLPVATLLAAAAGVVLAGSTSDRWFALPACAVGSVVAAFAVRRLLPAGTWRAVPGLPAAVAARLCATIAFGAVDSFVPLAAQRVHGVSSATKQGMLLVGAALMWSAGQAFSSRPSSQARPATFVRRGFAVLGVGALLVLPVAFAATPLVTTFLAWTIGGVGMGLLFNPTTVVAMRGVPEDATGLVSSQINMTDWLGFAIASTIGGAFVALAERNLWSINAGLAAIFAVGVGMALLGLLAVAGNVRHSA